MAKQKRNDAKVVGTHPMTIEARENLMISLASDLAEKQLREGTASSQVITHYLKLGTAKEKLERDKLQHENELLKAKTKAIESAERMEELYSEAIEAMKRYGGHYNGDYTNEDIQRANDV